MAMMATSGLPPSLSVPAPEDTMEISSDAGRNDQDVDIDLIGSQVGEDDVDYMLDDAPPAEDFMQDDDDEITYVEETMEDDFDQNAHPLDHIEPMQENEELTLPTDETLYDVTEDFQDDTQFADPRTERDGPVDAQAEPFTVRGTEESLVEENTLGLPADQPLELEQQYLQEIKRPDDEPTEAHAPASDSRIASELASPHVQPAKATADHVPVLSDATPQNDHTARAPPLDGADASEGLAQPGETDAEAALYAEPEATVRQHLRIEEETSAAAQSAFAFRELHPATVIFNEVARPFFPSPSIVAFHSALLQDPAIAHSTLTDLFHACREALCDDIDDQYELELYAGELDMTIYEDSIHCMTTSFAQLLDVFVSLIRNDGVENPDPLTVYLTPRIRFSSQLSTLFKAASERQGLHQAVSAEGELSDGGDDGIEDLDRELEARQENMGKDESLVEAANQVEKDVQGGEAEQSAIQEVAKPGTLLPENNDQEEREEPVKDQDEYEEPRDEHYVEERTQNFDAQDFEGREPAEEQETAQDAGVEQTFFADDEETQVDVEADRDGGSSGSSTIQGETHPATDYTDHETSSATVEVSPEFADEINAGDDPTQAQHEFDEEADPYLQQEDDADQGDHDNVDADTIEGWTMLAGNEEIDQATFDDASTNGPQLSAENALHDDQHQHPIERAHSGTFAVPDETDEEEDEITYDNEAAETQDLTGEQVPASPLGKRSRSDDEGEHVLDGSDQESKRLKSG